MSRLASLAGLVGRLPTVLRTLRPLRPAQARAQLHHALFGLPAPTRLGLAAPQLAVDRVRVPFLAPPAHVTARSGGSITLLATDFELGDTPDWESLESGPLFAYHLHQHEYLRLSAFSKAERAGRLLDWVRRHRSGIGWDPHPISLRLMCWGKLLLTPDALELSAAEREEVLASMADQAETLSRGLEIRLQANHLLSNLVSVVWAGVLLEGERSAVWRARTPELLAVLDEQLHADGGHEERSPMYHALILESLLDLLNLCEAAPTRSGEALRDALRRSAARMIRALAIWTHPDGRIALFADSAFDVAAEPAMLAGYADRLQIRDPSDPDPDPDSESDPDAPVGSEVLAQTGYVRLVAGENVLIASTAGPAPPHQPGHAHCDALSFELSLGGRRIVTDTGLFEYTPGPKRDLARATASHATLQIDGEEQAETWAAHRVGGRPEVALLGWDGERSAEASCRGWSRRSVVHHRRFEIDEEGLTVVDRVEGDCREVRLCLPIAPGWSVRLEQGGTRARVVAAGGETQSSDAGGSPRDALEVEIDLPQALRWRVERAPFFASFGVEQERDRLVGEGPRFDAAHTRIRIAR